MAVSWTATEDFESYSVGLLNGDNGGSGWSAGWVAIAGSTVVSSPVNSGTRSTQLHLGTGDATRTLTTGVTTGIFQCYVYVDIVPTGTTGFYIIFRQGATSIFFVGWGTGGSTGNNIGLSGDNVTYTNFGTGMGGTTWYKVSVEFDQPNGNARARLNENPWTTWVNTSGGSFTSIDLLRLTSADGTTNNYNVDDIGPGTALATVSSLPLLGVG